MTVLTSVSLITIHMCTCVCVIYENLDTLHYGHFQGQTLFLQEMRGLPTSPCTKWCVTSGILRKTVQLKIQNKLLKMI